MSACQSHAVPTERSAFLAGKLRSVHLELTTRCNARCPMCPRTGRGGTRPGLELVDLSLADIQAIFPPHVIKELRRIDVCGGFGDPLMADGFDDIIAYFRRENRKVELCIFTNGSLRPASWWGELAHRLAPAGQVIFGIDGLAETHVLYRIGTSFERILDNAQRFIAQGGRAQWDFIVFRHNEHEVEAARSLAQQLGFAAFSPKVSGRFYKRYYEDTPELPDDSGCESFPVYDGQGIRIRDLELPRDPRYRNPTMEAMKRIVSTRGSLTPALDGACVSCRAVADKSCFVSAEGTVFPCCWTYGASKYGTVFKMTGKENLQIAGLVEEHGGASALNAKNHPIYQIIDGPFFRALAQTWQKDTVAAGKAKICARMCGGLFSSEDQFLNPEFSPWRAAPGDGANPPAQCAASRQ
jgi:MoaA/NifB/PqqE/SkfB family radical SAM enzyme